jgi:hypothetical protein
MNLFALTKTAGSRILRFPLTAALQTEIDALFRQQLAAFEADVVETIPFDGRYVPDEGERLKIERFADGDPLVAAVANPLAVQTFDPAVHTLESISALFAGIDANDANDSHTAPRVLIQHFERRRLISTRGVAMFFSGNTFRRISDQGLTLDTRLLAVLDNGTLLFQSFYFLRQVFDMSGYYREATNDEVKAFATHPKLAVADLAGFVASAGPVIRKKISTISQSGILDHNTTEQIVATAQAFDVPIHVDEHNRIVVPSNKAQLRRLLQFLDEDYYKSPLSQTLFISNSKRAAR